MAELEAKFKDNPQDNTIFQQLVQQYQTQAQWQKLVDIYNIRGEFLQKSDRREAAASFFQAGWLFRHRLENFIPAYSFFSRAFNLEPDNEKFFLGLEDCCIETQRWQDLFQIYSEYLEIVEDRKTRLELLQKTAKLCADQLQHPEHAISLYSRARELDRDNEQLLHCLLVLFKSQKQWLAAIEILKALLKLSELHKVRDNLYLEIAGLWENLGECQRAVSCYRSVIGDSYQKIANERLARIVAENPENTVADAAKDLEMIEDDIARARTWHKLARSQQKLETAIDFCQRALEILPHDTAILEEMSQLFWQAQQFEQWYEYQMRLLEALATPESKLKLLADIAQHLKTVDQKNLLIDTYERILHYRPQNIEVIDHLEQMYREDRNYEALLKLLIHKSKNCALTERIATYFQIAKLLSESLNASEQAQYYEKILTTEDDSGKTVDVFKEQYLKEGKYAQLIELMEKRVAQEPALADAYYREIGEIYRDLLQQPQQAITAFTKATVANPSSWEAYAALLALLRDIDHRQYLEIATKALAIAPESEIIAIHMSMAKLYLAQNEAEYAEKHFWELLRYNPSHKEALAQLAQLYQDQQRWQDYVDILEDSVCFWGTIDDLPQQYLQIAQVYKDHLHLYKRAAHFYQKAHLAAPMTTSILSEWQQAAQENGDENSLIYCLTNLAQLCTDAKNAFSLYCRLGEIFNQRRELPKAIDAYQQALVADPNAAPVIDQLIVLYRKHQDYQNLFAMLETQARHLKDPQQLIDTYRELVKLAHNELEQPQNVIFYGQKIFALQPDNQDIVELLTCAYQEQQMWGQLIALYYRLLDICDDDATKLPLLEKIAAIYRRQVPNSEELKGVYLQIAAITPENSEILSATQQLCRQLRDWSGLLKVCRLELQNAHDERAAQLYYEMGDIYAKHLPSMDDAIRCYEKTLTFSGDHSSVLQELCTLYTTKRDYHNALIVIDKSVQIAVDPELQANLLLKKALIYRDRLRDNDSAIAHLQEALQLYPTMLDAIEALEDIFRRERRFHELLDLLQGKQDILSTDEALELEVEIARIYEQELQQPQSAKQHLLQVLQQNPQHTGAYKNLETLYQQHENWQQLLQLYQDQLPHVCNPGEKVPLLFAIGKLYEEKLHEQAQASLYYVQVLTIESAHLPAIQSLQKIYEQQRQASSLAEAYLAELAVPEISTQRRITLHLLSADLFANELKLPQQAIHHFQQSLELDSSNLLSIRGLQHIYRERNDYAALAEMLVAELAMIKNSKRLVAIHLELADIQLSHLKDHQQAIKNLTRAYRYHPHDRKIFDKLKHVLRQNNRWQQYAEYLLEDVQQTDVVDKRRRIHLELSTIYQDKLDNNNQAIFHLEQAIALGDSQCECLQRLSKLYRQEGVQKNASKLAVVYELEKDLLANDKPRLKELLFALGSLYERDLKHANKAVEYWEALQELDPLRKDVYEILTQLYLKLKEWEKLAQLFYNRLGICRHKNEQREILAKTGNIWEKKLDNPSKAIGYYQMALVVDPESPAALQGMRRILEQQGDWHGVLEVLYREAKLTSGTEQATLYLKIAKLWESRLKLIPQAVEAYMQVMKSGFHMTTAEHLLSLLASTKEYKTFCWLIQKVIRRTKDIERKIQRWCEMGDVLFRQLKKNQQAIKAYKAALKLSPEYVDALSGLEEIYLAEQQWQDLVQIKERKLQLTSNSKQIRKLHLELGQMSQQYLYDEKKAILHYELALKLGGEDLALIHTLQQLYYSWGYFDKYNELCTSEIGLIRDPARKIKLYLHIATTWEQKLFDDERAILHFEKVLELDADNAKAIDALISLYARNHVYEKLIALYELKSAKLTDAEHDVAKLIDLKLAMAEIWQQNLHDHARAEKTLREVLELSPGNQRALTTLENMFADKENMQQLAEVLTIKIAQSKTPEQISLYCQLGQLYEKSSDTLSQAADAYENAHRLQSQNKEILDNLQTLYRRMDNTEALIATNCKLLEVSDNEQRVALYWELSALLKDSDVKQSIGYLERILDLQKGDYQTFSMLADLLQQQQNWNKLENVFSMWIEAEANSSVQSKILTRRGRLYLDCLHSKSKAMADFISAFELDPRNLQAITTLGALYVQDQQWERAEPLYEQLVNWPEPEKVAKFLLANELYFQWAKIAEHLQKQEIAILRYQKNLQIAPDYLPALEALGSLYYKNGQWEQALLIYMKMHSSDISSKSRVEVLLRLAVIKDKMGMKEGAIEGYLQVLQANPNELIALEALAGLYWEKQQEEKALEYCLRLRELAEDAQLVHRALSLLVQIYEFMEDIGKAIATQEQIVVAEKPKRKNMQKLLKLYMQDERWDNAVACGKQMAHLVASTEEAVELDIVMGNIMWQGFRDEEQALYYYRRALEKTPTYIPAIHAQANIYKNLQDWHQVVNIYRQCVANFPQNASEQTIPLLLEQAKIMQDKLHQVKESIGLYEQILEIAPDHPGAHTALAMLWAKYPERRNDAISEHLYLLSEDPFRNLSYQELWRMYLENKEYDNAYLCCQALSAMDKLQPQHRDFLQQIPSRVPSGWLDTWTLDQLMKEDDRGALYEIMASVDPYTDRAYPPNLEEKYQLRRKDKISNDSEEPIAIIINNVMRLLGIHEIALFLSELDIVTIENTQPPSLIIGRGIVRELSSSQMYFVVAHYLFYVSRNHVMAKKLLPLQYSQYVMRLVEAFADTGKEMSAQEEAIGNKLRTALPRRNRKQLEDRMDILTEIYRADISKFLQSLVIAANKFGLLVADSLKESIVAYRFLEQRQESEKKREFYDLPEIKDLFWFNVSEQHRKLRTELGLAVKWIR